MPDHFRFNAEAGNAWPVGQYEAVIAHTEVGASKKGDPMLTVTYTVFHPNGSKQTMKDYFVQPNVEEGRKGNMFRLRQLCAALGDNIYASWKSGDLVPERQLRNANVLLTLGIEESVDFGDKNKVTGYAPLQRRSALAAGAEDDEVPF